MSYAWKTGHPKPKEVDAETFGLALENINEKFERVIPQKVVDTARNPRSPIHACFNWNDKVMAESARRQRARQLIGSLVFVKIEVPNTKPLEVRAFHSLREAPYNRRSYLPVARIMTSKDLKASLLGDAAKSLEEFLLRFQGIIAVASPATTHVHEAIDAIRDHVKKLEWEAARRAPRKEHGDDNRTTPVA